MDGKKTMIIWKCYKKIQFDMRLIKLLMDLQKENPNDMGFTFKEWIESLEENHHFN